MRLILDTNVLISASIKDSLTRSILISPYFEFYMPEYGLSEVERYQDLLEQKSGLSKEKLDILMDNLVENIQVIPVEDFVEHLPVARKVLRDIDIDDAPFLALALFIPNEGLWSEDKKLQKQKKVKVWKTIELKTKLEEFSGSK